MKNPPHYVIGIFGASESGKGTVSNLLEWKLAQIGYSNVRQHALAQPLKDACAALDVVKGDTLFRRLICGIDDIIRKLDGDFLWKLFFRRELVATPARHIFILNDPRYKGQAAHCDYTVKLLRSTAKSKMTAEEAAHQTEVDWMNIVTDVTYMNEDPSDPEIIAGLIIDKILPDLLLFKD